MSDKRHDEPEGPPGKGGRVGDWSPHDVELLIEAGIFTLRKIRAASSNEPDKVGEFVYIDAPDWVNVIALTASGQVVLIEQYRHGIGAVTLEIPGGTVDDGEDPVTAGLRELAEETGYTGKSVEVIGTVTPNPAILNNVCTTLLVRNAERTREPELDTMEEIAVRLEPVENVADLIRSGEIDHALVVAAFHLFDLMGH
jgi:8-oxo-dGTP pyrophosphatase MutT (NUDIX family)